MFYVKEKLNGSIELSIEITDVNVFSRCIECGEELAVDLADILTDSDLSSAAVLCTSCATDWRPRT